MIDLYVLKKTICFSELIMMDSLEPGKDFKKWKIT